MPIPKPLFYQDFSVNGELLRGGQQMSMIPSSATAIVARLLPNRFVHAVASIAATKK